MDGNSGRGGRWFAQVARELLVVVAKLETPDDRRPVCDAQLGERCFVALQTFGAEQTVQWRRVIGSDGFADRALERHSRVAAPLTGNLVVDCLAQIERQSAVLLDVETRQLAHG